MNLKRSIIKVLSILLVMVMLCSIGGIAAVNIATASVETPVQTDAVNIKLSVYHEKDGSLSLLEDKQYPGLLLPGDTVPYVVNVDNLGTSAYLRVKTLYSSDNEIKSMIPVLEGQNKLDEARWTKVGDYYYLKEPVKPGETVNLMSGFEIPATIGNDAKDKSFTVRIIAEAIQDKNMTQDLSSSDPWGTTPIEKVIDNSYTIENKVMISIDITYKNGAENFISVPKDFFEELASLMPGDKITKTVDIKNPTEKQVKNTVEISPKGDLTQREKNLLSKLTLVIKDGDKVIYSGSVITNGKIDLGTYKKGESGKITFTIEMPRELGNDYSIIRTLLDWEFNSEYESETPPKPGTTPKDSPNMGRLFDTQKLTVTAAVSGMLLIILFFVDRKLKKEEEDKQIYHS